MSVKDRARDIQAAVDFIREEYWRYGSDPGATYVLWKRACAHTTISRRKFLRLYEFAVRCEAPYSMSWRERWRYYLFGDTEESNTRNLYTGPSGSGRHDDPMLYWDHYHSHNNHHHSHHHSDHHT